MKEHIYTDKRKFGLEEAMRTILDAQTHHAPTHQPTLCSLSEHRILLHLAEPVILQIKTLLRTVFIASLNIQGNISDFPQTFFQ